MMSYCAGRNLLYTFWVNISSRTEDLKIQFAFFFIQSFNFEQFDLPLVLWNRWLCTILKMTHHVHTGPSCVYLNNLSTQKTDLLHIILLEHVFTTFSMINIFVLVTRKIRLSIIDYTRFLLCNDSVNGNNYC